MLGGGPEGGSSRFTFLSSPTMSRTRPKKQPGHASGTAAHFGEQYRSPGADAPPASTTGKRAAKLREAGQAAGPPDRASTRACPASPGSDRGDG